MNHITMSPAVFWGLLIVAFGLGFGVAALAARHEARRLYANLRKMLGDARDDLGG